MSSLANAADPNFRTTISNVEVTDLDVQNLVVENSANLIGNTFNSDGSVNLTAGPVVITKATNIIGNIIEASNGNVILVEGLSVLNGISQLATTTAQSITCSSLTRTNTLQVDSTSVFTGAATFNGGVILNGNVTLNDNLTVLGDTSLEATDINGSLDIYGATSFNNNIDTDINNQSNGNIVTDAVYLPSNYNPSAAVSPPIYSLTTSKLLLDAKEFSGTGEFSDDMRAYTDGGSTEINLSNLGSNFELVLSGTIGAGASTDIRIQLYDTTDTLMGSGGYITMMCKRYPGNDNYPVQQSAVDQWYLSQVGNTDQKKFSGTIRFYTNYDAADGLISMSGDIETFTNNGSGIFGGLYSWDHYSGYFVYGGAQFLGYIKMTIGAASVPVKYKWSLYTL